MITITVKHPKLIEMFEAKEMLEVENMFILMNSMQKLYNLSAFSFDKN